MSPRAMSDERARRIATTDFDRNLVVEAGAGTGKTSLLVERLLVALGSGRVEVTGFAAISFTEKAAAELRSRLAGQLDRLRAAAAGGAADADDEPSSRALRALRLDGVPDAAVAERSLQALLRIDRARACTIHSFCSGLLRAWPVDAGVEPGFRVEERRRGDAVLAETWTDFLERETGISAPRRDLWRRVLGAFGTREVRKVAWEAARFGIPEESFRADGAAAALRRLRSEARAVAERAASILERQRGMSDLPRLYLETSARWLEGFASADGGVPSFDAEARTCFSRRSPPGPNARLSGVGADEYDAAARSIHRLVGRIATLRPEDTAALVEAVELFAREAREAWLSAGALDFDALVLLARNLLRDRPDVRERERRTLRMILVDEFQDTDPLQHEIVLYLSGRLGESETDAYRVPLESGRLFVVGDPKQSIYRFRGADHSEYRRAVARIVNEGGAQLTLSSNFRSVPGVLAPVNALFQATWSADDYQPPYEPVAPVRQDAEGRAAVEILAVDAAADASDRREQEGRAIAAEIRRLVAGEGRAWRDVMVLLRAFSDVALYLRALRAADVPFVVAGGRDFLERSEVSDILSVLRAVARPSDPVALLAFLRSPVGGVPDTELAAHAAGGGRWHRDLEPDPSRFPELARALRLLRRITEETRQLPDDRRVSRVLAMSGLVPLGALGFEGRQRVANLRKIAGIVSNAVREGATSLNEALDALEEGGADRDSDSPLADEETDAVRVLTIHKAKGLESPVVFLADVSGGQNPGRGKGAVSLARIDGKPVIGIHLDRWRNAAGIVGDLETRRHDDAEARRLFYVACTRARERLVLVVGPPNPSRWVRDLSAWGYDGDVPPADGEMLAGGSVRYRVAGGPPSPPSARAPASTDRQRAAVDRCRVALLAARKASPPAFLAPSRRSGDAGPPAGAGDRSVDGIVARAVGIAVHRVLELWDPAERDGWKGLVPRSCARAARDLGVDPRRASIEGMTVEILDAFARSPLREILVSSEVMAREMPMLMRDEDGAHWRGSIDLIYRDRRGRVAVADYKTDAAIDDREIWSRYGPQVSLYAEAVRRSLRLEAPPRSELWRVREGRIVTAPDEPR